MGLATAGSMMFAYTGTVLGPTLFAGLASAVGFPKAYLVMGAAVLSGGLLGAFGGARRTRFASKFFRHEEAQKAQIGSTEF